MGIVKGSVDAPAGFQLRIELREVLPTVWRRFLVPGAITLPGLHRVIQEVMGWENCHLHLFRFGAPEDVGGPPGYMEYLEALRDPSHPDHEQMVEWRGTSFDPERFDPAGINHRLSLLSRKRQ